MKKIGWELSKLELEDPFVTKICDKIILGAVSILLHPVGTMLSEFSTVFYKGRYEFRIHFQ